MMMAKGTRQISQYCAWAHELTLAYKPSRGTRQLVLGAILEFTNKTQICSMKADHHSMY